MLNTKDRRAEAALIQLSDSQLAAAILLLEAIHAGRFRGVRDKAAAFKQFMTAAISYTEQLAEDQPNKTEETRSGPIQSQLWQ